VLINNVPKRKRKKEEKRGKERILEILAPADAGLIN